MFAMKAITRANLCNVKIGKEFGAFVLIVNLDEVMVCAKSIIFICFVHIKFYKNCTTISKKITNFI